MVEHKYYEKGDFGALHQVRTELGDSEIIMDFWGSGWLGVSIYDFKKDEYIVNELIEPDEESRKALVIKKLNAYLAIFLNNESNKSI